jgi:C1A family cysteine protease
MPSIFSSLVVSTAVTLLLIIFAVVCASAQSNLPKFIDWRARGMVGPVKDQGQCGNPMLYATIGNIQSISAITNGKFVNLSYTEVELCASTGGCNGGLSKSTYQWILSHGGKIAPASANVTTASCANLASLPVGAKVEAVRSITRSEEAIHQALVDGPVFAAVDATSWELYNGGVLSNCQSSQIDHAALIVGINLDAKPAYWILQNSWGSTWGANGYIFVEYGKNECGINASPLTVTCAKL